MKKSIKFLLDNSPYVDLRLFGNIGGNAYKLTDEAFFEIQKYGTFLKWQKFLISELKAKEEKENKRLEPFKKAERIKNWRERNWFLIAAIAYAMGLLTPIIQKSIERKIWSKSQEVIQDTSNQNKR